MKAHCALVVCVVLLCACGSPSGRLNPAPPLTPVTGGGGVPGLTELAQAGLDLPRLTASVHSFGGSDLVQGEHAAFTDSVLALERDSFSFAILGAKIGGLLPEKLSLSGSCDGLWIGVSDYAAGAWRWIGTNLSQAGDLALGEGEFTTAGTVFFALVCPPGNAGDIELSLVLDDTNAGTWNLLVWFNGDNGFDNQGYDSGALRDLNLLETVGSTAQINILAGFDINPANDLEDILGIDQVRFIKVVQDDDDNRVVVDGDPANLSFPRAGYDSSDPAHIAEFTDWAAANFPADHTALVIWGPGNGWHLSGTVDPCFRKASGRVRQGSALLADGSDGSGMLRCIQDTVDALAGRHFDVLILDAGMMAQVETLYEFHELADWMVASKIHLSTRHYYYDQAITAWLAGFPLAAQDVAKTFVQARPESSQHAEVVVSTDGISNLAAELDNLCTELIPKAEAEHFNFEWAISDSFEGFGHGLGHILQAYTEQTTDAELQAILARAMTAVGSTVYYESDNTNYDIFAGVSIEAYPMPLFTPYQQDAYSQLRFDQATGWLDMLTAVNPLIMESWSPGGEILIDWDFLPADFDLVITDPLGRLGSPYLPEDLAGIIQFSQDSYDSGLTEEWGILLPGAPEGCYTISICLVDLTAPPPDTLEVDLRLGRSGEELTKIYTCEPDPDLMLGVTFPLVELFYTTE